MRLKWASRRLRRICDVAEAVSYRRPRRVRQVFRTDRGSTYPVCPRCKRTMEREYMYYCDRCGQKLSWRFFGFATVRGARGGKS